ncbi:hypothetical protein [Streptomyces sp. NPDC048106]|uniref:hypothetical protein n=1 Tax=Streptomyces sp. NPDC048106 TaxID=3155750 RepID=UPI0034531B3F
MKTPTARVLDADESDYIIGGEATSCRPRASQVDGARRSHVAAGRHAEAVYVLTKDHRLAAVRRPDAGIRWTIPMPQPFESWPSTSPSPATASL